MVKNSDLSEIAITSASDNYRYPAFCELASKNNAAFSNFKRDPTYTQILEHVSKEHGKQYLKHILNDSDIINNLSEYARNDDYGNPRTYYYRDIKRHISPTTLRYLKVLYDLKHYFNLDDVNSIAEIGCGYGGQCRIILEKHAIQEYYIVDLPQVLLLIRRFLSNFEDVNTRTKYVCMENLPGDKSYDLVISNYAFSELKKPIQDEYLDKIILKSKRGYITYNSLSYDLLGGYSDTELLSIIPNSIKSPEYPLTYPGNCIIMWGIDE